MRFLSDRIGFLLNATLGLISNEQNQIIKLFSVMAVMLMPPTLVASIYGMNFRHMPRTRLAGRLSRWALGLMVLSAVIPFIYFRRKGLARSARSQRSIEPIRPAAAQTASAARMLRVREHES